jgi:hypothetical protein
MPQERRGQQISFSIEKDPDQRFEKWIHITPKVGLTIADIAAKFGNPEDSQSIRKKNGVRSVNYVLRTRKPKRKKGEASAAFKKRLEAWKKRKKFPTLLVPGNFKESLGFHVLAGDTPPKITRGYAKFEIKDRPERTGLIAFQGYDPIEMTVPIRFESVSVSDGGTKEARHGGSPVEKATSIEEDCALLEQMAGRGQFTGAAVGPPAIITVSTTGNGDSDQNSLIPPAYQVSRQNPSGPRWRIADIDWDDSSMLRNRYGNRIRALAVVTLWEHSDLTVKTRSATKRAQIRNAGRGKKAKPKPRKR